MMQAGGNVVAIGRQETGINPLIKRTLTPNKWANKEAPERLWVVEGLIPTGSVTMISGDGGLGKSLLAAQLQIAAALGVPWLGRETANIRSVALYCEDDEDELHRRMKDIAEHYEADLNDERLAGAMFMSRVGAENSMVDFKSVFDRDTGERKALWEVSETYLDVIDWARQQHAQLLILDSLHDFFHGNENDRAMTRYFVNQLRVIAQEIEGAVVVLSHPSVAGMASGSGASGSTAWNNAMRSRLYLTRPKEDDDSPADRDLRVLKTMKANYSQIGGEIKLRWDRGVFTVESDLSGGMVGSIEQRNCENAFLAGLRILQEQSRGSSDKSRASTYAPKLVRSLACAKGFQFKDLERAMVNLLAEGKIKMAHVGIGADRHPVYGLAEIGSEDVRAGAGWS